MSNKIALLIDAENISYKDLPHILETISQYGDIVVKAVYGDWQSSYLHTWYDTAQEYGCTIRHHTRIANTKNSADIKLVIDAMEILYCTPVNLFCLASNDADFIPLCEKIHETSKRYIIGIGYKHASEALKKACNGFIAIEHAESELALPVYEPEPVDVSIPEPEPVVRPLTSEEEFEIRQLLAEALPGAALYPDRWVALSDLGEALRYIQRDVKTLYYEHSSLSKLLETMPDFIELRHDNATTLARLRRPHTLLTVTNILELILEAFSLTMHDIQGWALLSSLSKKVNELEPHFHTKDYGYSSLFRLLLAMDDEVEIRIDHTGIMFARIRNKIYIPDSQSIPLHTLIIEVFARTDLD
ncbi:MAG: NYN domain-containing protein, partial [Aggregatilineales bacterium]